jgi:DNA-binding transcriptional ArsR family regulator
MPTADASLTQPGTDTQPIAFEVRPSLPMELLWLTFLAKDDSPFPIRTDRFAEAPEMAARLAEFWADGERCFTEVLVAADRGGVLFEDDLERMWAGLAAGAAAPARPEPLTSENPEDRARYRARLARLHDEPDLRAAWLRLLQDAWAVVAERWQEDGRPAADRLRWEVRGRIPETGTYADLLPLVDGCDFGGLLPRLVSESAAAGQRVVLVPAWMGRKGYVLSLPGCILWCPPNGARPAGPSAETRARARQHKALGDPTRLAIFEAVACRPRAVGELARELGVAQPTVSNHVRILRDAELLIQGKDDGRRLAPNVAAFERFLDQSRRVVLPVTPNITEVD